MMKLSLVTLILTVSQVAAFVHNVGAIQRSSSLVVASSLDEWQGDIVAGGSIRGCSIQQAGESVSEWIITVDGDKADLGRFSEAIYKKILVDAKQQRFQGFRPGTIPPHLQSTYKGFAMDECARETVLEAMQQNSIRPFSDASSQILFENVSVPPPKKKGGNKKKKGGRKKKGMVVEAEAPVVVETEPEPEPQWKIYETMNKAIDAGWMPGQSFSFIAKNVKGQKVLSNNELDGAEPIVKPGLF